VRELGWGELEELIAARLSGQVKSEKEQNFHLGNKGFGRSDTDFQASPGVNDLVGGLGNGGIHDVADSQRPDAAGANFLEGRQRVSRLPRLRDKNSQIPREKNRTAIAEFAGILDLSRQTGNFLEVVATD